jgi:hypothetical protein
MYFPRRVYYINNDPEFIRVARKAFGTIRDDESKEALYTAFLLVQDDRFVDINEYLVKKFHSLKPPAKMNFNTKKKP